MPALHSLPADAVAFAEALRSRRDALGLSQDDLAARLTDIGGEPFPRQTISNYERGLSGGRGRAPLNVEWKRLVLLCSALESTLVVDTAHPSGVRVEFVPREV